MVYFWEWSMDMGSNICTTNKMFAHIRARVAYTDILVYITQTHVTNELYFLCTLRTCARHTNRQKNIIEIREKWKPILWFRNVLLDFETLLYEFRMNYSHLIYTLRMRCWIYFAIISSLTIPFKWKCVIFFIVCVGCNSGSRLILYRSQTSGELL